VLNSGFMNTVRLSLKLLVRDWRAGELTVLAVALLIAVSALTGVAFLTDRAAQAVEMRATESLAADLRLASTRPISDDYIQLAHAAGLATARIASMPSVVQHAFRHPCYHQRLPAEGETENFAKTTG